jgi:hypothetical protein
LVIWACDEAGKVCEDGVDCTLNGLEPLLTDVELNEPLGLLPLLFKFILLPFTELIGRITGEPDFCPSVLPLS